MLEGAHGMHELLLFSKVPELLGVSLESLNKVGVKVVYRDPRSSNSFL